MLAAAAPGRSSEQQRSKDSINHDPAHDTYRSPKSTHSGRTPSISPLSTTSKSHNDSAISSAAILSNVINGARAQLDEEAEEDAPDGADERDRSSSLSDVDPSVSEQEQDGPESDSEDELSRHSDEEDSEAETERVNPTPQKPVKTIKLTPQRGLHTVIEDAVSDADSARMDEDEEPARQQMSLAGRKRKRGMLQPDGKTTSDETDSDAALAKRRGLRSTEPALNAEAQADDEEAEEDADEADEAMAISAPQSPSKERMRKGGKVQKEPKDHEEEEVGQEDAEGEAVEEAATDRAEEVGPEELARREQALLMISSLSGRFGNLKSKLQADRILKAEAELAQLQQAHPMHNEYIRQLQAVTIRRDTKIRQEMKLLQYKKQTLKTSTLANRAQLLSQYAQDSREVRERVLYELGKQWYDIQKGRREAQADEIDNGLEYRFPKKRTTQIRHQAKYNAEVSVLSGVAKYVGFPAAPELSGVKDKHLEDDLRAMQIPKRETQPVQQSQDIQVRVAPTPSIPTSEHLAHEEFVKHTPWANPHHPVHSQSRTPSAFGHHHAAPVPTPPFSMLTRPTSTFSTPQLGTDKQPSSDHRPPGSNETIGILSDPPSSVLAAPPTVDRIRLIPFENGGDTSPLAHLKRAAGQRRDFSGLSGTSTIDAPMDPGMRDDRPPSVPFEAPPQHQQMMAASGGQGRESQG